MAHEDLHREEGVEGSSDRSFGFVFTTVFLLVALWPLLRRGDVRLWALIPAVAFGMVSLVRPGILAPLNRLWTKLGVLMGRIVSPLALGVLFYLVMAPMGVLLRLLRQDLLRLKRDPHAITYWTPRQPPGPPPDSMNQQF